MEVAKHTTFLRNHRRKVCFVSTHNHWFRCYEANGSNDRWRSLCLGTSSCSWPLLLSRASRIPSFREFLTHCLCPWVWNAKKYFLSSQPAPDDKHLLTKCPDFSLSVSIFTVPIIGHSIGLLDLFCSVYKIVWCAWQSALLLFCLGCQLFLTTRYY